MQIEILLFGILRDLIGHNSLKKEVSKATTLDIILEEIAVEYPKIRSYSNFAVAVNEAYVDKTYVLKENDIVALIPPVSGG